MNTHSNTRLPRWAVRPIVPEEVYTDRREHLDYLCNAALNAVSRRTVSTVLLGQRRMGKTEIFKRTVNRLFFEQEHYQDPGKSAVPVYYKFEDTFADRWDFSLKYAENFLRWYAAFRLRDPNILSEKSVKREELSGLISEKLTLSRGLQGMLNFFETLREKGVTVPEQSVLTLPRWVSDIDDSTIVMFLDEFQNTRLPQYSFDIVGYMQDAAESPTCPHFVTGSAMSILAREILGRGSLFGRFDSEPIEAMTPYWGAELALKSASHYHAGLPESMAPVIARRCGGNPFYITAVVRQSAKQNKALSDESRLDEILAVDLSSGFIWGELGDQVSRWIERLNEYGITKWILYLSALEEGDRIDIERIQRELYEREGKNVPLQTVRDILIKLSRGDLLDYMELGGWFRKVQDPILLDFLKVWGRIEVEGKNRSDVQNELRLGYQSFHRRISDHIGYFGEVCMAQVLWNSQNKTLPGKFFHSEEDISVTWHFSYIRHRVRLGASADTEIDVYGAAGSEIWICESKWRSGGKTGRKDVEILLHKAELAKEQAGKGLEILRVWFFSYNGFTEDAESLMKEKGVLRSGRDDLNGLLAHAGLRKLPELQS